MKNISVGQYLFDPIVFGVSLFKTQTLAWTGKSNKSWEERRCENTNKTITFFFLESKETYEMAIY